jgi:hypothetical protein
VLPRDLAPFHVDSAIKENTKSDEVSNSGRVPGRRLSNSSGTVAGLQVAFAGFMVSAYMLICATRSTANEHETLLEVSLISFNSVPSFVFSRDFVYHFSIFVHYNERLFGQAIQAQFLQLCSSIRLPFNAPRSGGHSATQCCRLRGQFETQLRGSLL